MSVQRLTKKHRSRAIHKCAVCDSPSIGINFGVPTCAPCKAFFRRNGRRKEILNSPCQLLDPNSLLNDNKDLDFNMCSELRQCSSCRLRRCYNVGMKVELIRTDEENQRYNQLIQINRQRRQELKLHENQPFKIPKLIVSKDGLLKEMDWRLLSNIVYSYENYCLKLYTQHRDKIKFSEDSLTKIEYHQSLRINNMKSLLSFLYSIPMIRSLSKTNRIYLCQHNIRFLIFPNLHELEQTCFTESYQINQDNKAAEYVYGKEIFADSVQMKIKANLILITDPVVTRLWLVILFFSSPLLCYYDCSLPEISDKNRLILNQIQNSFINLLWNYLSHRHGYFDAVRIFANFIRIYLQMQSISRQINHQKRTRMDLISMNQAFTLAAVFQSDI